MQPLASLHLPAHCGQHAPAPLDENERVLTQYGPDWIAAVLDGAGVRNGNVVTP